MKLSMMRTLLIGLVVVGCKGSSDPAPTAAKANAETQCSDLVPQTLRTRLGLVREMVAAHPDPGRMICQYGSENAGPTYKSVSATYNCKAPFDLESAKQKKISAASTMKAPAPIFTDAPVGRGAVLFQQPPAEKARILIFVDSDADCSVEVGTNDDLVAVAKELEAALKPGMVK